MKSNTKIQVLASDMHQKQDVCPVCFSNNIHKISPTTGNIKPNRYTKILDKKYEEQNGNEAYLRFNLFSCSNCFCSFWNPFYSIDARINLFTKEFNDHGAGWSIFLRQNYLNNKHNETLEAKALIKVLDKYIDIKNYSEVNCPFLGLFPYLQNLGVNANKVMKIMTNNSYAKGGVLLNISTKINEKFLSYKFRKSQKKEFKPQLSNLNKIDLITVPTTLGWNQSCNRYGLGCTQVVNTIPVDFAIKNNRYDLIGFFNTFDHIDDPISILKKLLSITKHIIIGNHSADDAGPQHST
jgi:hypothetical protein